MKWDISNFDNWKVDDYSRGAIGLEAGNSTGYLTGGWRSMRPIWDSAACKQCMLCWVNCPDSSIQTTPDGAMTGIDLEHCKGCGICVQACSFGALKMVPEYEAEEG